MIDIYAASNVAAMKNEQSSRDRTIRFLPSKAMRKNSLATAAAAIGAVAVVGVSAFP